MRVLSHMTVRGHSSIVRPQKGISSVFVCAQEEILNSSFRVTLNRNTLWRMFLIIMGKSLKKYVHQVYLLYNSVPPSITDTVVFTFKVDRMILLKPHDRLVGLGVVYYALFSVGPPVLRKRIQYVQYGGWPWQIFGWMGYNTVYLSLSKMNNAFFSFLMLDDENGIHISLVSLFYSADTVLCRAGWLTWVVVLHLSSWGRDYETVNCSLVSN